MPRDELLVRIIAAGDRRRRRRHAAIGGGVAAAVVVLGAVLAWPGDDGADRGRVDVAAQTDGTTTTDATATTSTTGPADTTTTSTSTTTTTEAAPSDTTATTPVTEPELVCRNSRDPACGPFYWDTPPGFVNQPITITADGEPLHAVAGQTVDLVFRADDPDASACADSIDLGGGRLVGQEHDCLVPACGITPRYGPWDPPAIEHLEDRNFVGGPDAPATAIYDTPGTYTITVTAFSYTMCGGADLYESTGTATFTIVVAPA